jgi:hypothetical protein
LLLLSVQEVRERGNLLHAACLVFVHGVCILYTYIMHTYIRIYIHVVCVCVYINTFIPPMLSCVVLVVWLKTSSPGEKASVFSLPQP